MNHDKASKMIQTPLAYSKRRKSQRAIFAVVFGISFLMSLNVAYANVFNSIGDTIMDGIDILNPIDDIIGAILLFFFKMIVTLVAAMMDALISPVQTLTSYSMDDLNAIIPLYASNGESFGAVASKYVNNLAIFIWIMLALFGIFANMIYTAQGSKKAEPPGRMFINITLSGVFTFLAQDFMYIMFDEIVQPLTAEFNQAINNASFSSSNDFFDTLASTIIGGMQTGLVSIILATIMLILIGINFFKLALEMVQRYVIIAFLCILSPLGFAAGGCQETRDVSKRWFRMFWSQSILLFLNVWCIAISLQCMINVQSSSDILIWALVTYGFIKVALQLDDILKNAGLDITRQTSGLMQDLWTAGHVVGGVMNAAGNLAATGKGFVQDAAAVRSGNMTAGQAMANVAKNLSRSPIMATAMAPLLPFTATALGATGATARKEMEQHFAKTGAERLKEKKDYNSPLAKQTAKNVLSNSDDKNLRAAAKNGDIKLNNSLDKDGSITGVATTKNADGSITRTGFKISGNGTASQTQATGISRTGRDANGNATITDSKLGTFRVDQDRNDPSKYNLTQVADADGNELKSGDNPMTMSVKDAAAGSEAEAANHVLENGGLQQMQNHMEDAKNFANMSPSDRATSGMDMSSVNQDALQNVAASKMNETDSDILGDNGKIVGMNMDQDGNLTATVAKTDGGLTTMQDYAIGSGGAEAIGNEKRIAVSEDGTKAAFQNKSTGTAFSMEKTRDANGHEQWKVSQLDETGAPMTNGMQFTAPAVNGESAQDAAMRVSDSDMANAKFEGYHGAVDALSSGNSAKMNELNYNTPEVRAAYSSVYGATDDVPSGSTMVGLTKTETGTTASYVNGNERYDVTRNDGQAMPVSTNHTIAEPKTNADGTQSIITTGADGTKYETSFAGQDGDKSVYSVKPIEDANGTPIVQAPERTFSMPATQDGKETTMNDVASYMVSDRGMNVMNSIDHGRKQAVAEYSSVDPSQNGAKLNHAEEVGSAIATDIAGGNFNMSATSSPNAAHLEDMQESFANGSGQIFMAETRNEHGGVTFDAVHTDPDSGRQMVARVEQQEDGSFKVNAPMYAHQNQEEIGSYYENLGREALTGQQGLGNHVYDGMMSEQNSEPARKSFAESAKIPEAENVTGIRMPVKDSDYFACNTHQEIPVAEADQGRFANHEVVRTRTMTGGDGGEVTARTDIFTSPNGKECTVALYSGDTTDSFVNRMVLSNFDGKNITINHDGQSQTIQLKKNYGSVGQVATEFNGVRDGDDFNKVIGRISGKNKESKKKKK